LRGVSGLSDDVGVADAQDLSRPRQRGHARRGVDRHPAGLAADDRDLPGVDAGERAADEVGAVL
jgi:hypothetical protein